MNRSKRILVAPLDWGLGHAARCVPLIRSFKEEGHEVILAAEGSSYDFFKLQFPELEILHLKGYRVKYSSIIPLSLMIFFQVPKIVWRVFSEHRWIKRIVIEKKIDEIISDNRYGLWHKNVKCVFITHQLMIKLPTWLKFMEGLMHKSILWFVKKYNECWVPDAEGNENLSGDLSHKYPIPANCKYIGWLSRFQNSNISNGEIKYELCALLSGPEPQRSILEKIINQQLMEMKIRAIVIQGKPGYFQDSFPRTNYRLVSHLDDAELANTIRSSSTIVCRSGYSTIMDMVALGCNAVLIPTPGQTEQEYLAMYLENTSNFSAVTQEKLALTQLLNQKVLNPSNKKAMTTLF